MNIGAMFESNAVVKILIFLNVAIFILGAFIDRLFGNGVFYNMFELSTQSLASGKVWTLLTYSFLHANLLHITLNMLGLYFMGTPLAKWIGAKKFLALYIFGALLGALVWLPTSLASPAGLVGASASVIAVFACFCFFYPPMPITFLLFFVIPISMRPMTMLKLATAIEALGFVYSLSGGDSSVAYAAHLGGIAAGVLFAMGMRSGKLNFIDNISWNRSRNSAESGFGQSKPMRSASEFNYKVNITDPVELRREVDRILDKISRSGFSSLTDDERQTLRKAKSYLK